MAINTFVIVDAGPLVAFLCQRDSHHNWAKAAVENLPTPFFTSEAVISEACFLLNRYGVSHRHLFEMIDRETIHVAFSLQEEFARIAALMSTYANRPMSLADATLVRMAELQDEAVIFTVDEDFRIYRKNGRQQIPLLIPDKKN